MKIALSVNTPDLDAAIDPRFGRAAYLLVVDTATGEWLAHENPGQNASGGAGVQAAQFVAGLGVQAVISGEFGPHAFDALHAAQIAMYTYGDCHTAQDAIERFKAGGLRQTGAASAGGRHGRSA